MESVITSYSIHYTKLYETMAIVIATVQTFGFKKAETSGSEKPSCISVKDGKFTKWLLLTTAKGEPDALNNSRITSYNVCYTKLLRGSNRDNNHFKHFLNISLGSSFELQTQLLIALQNKYLTEERAIEIENKIIEFQKMTYGFIIV